MLDLNTLPEVGLDLQPGATIVMRLKFETLGKGLIILPGNTTQGAGLFVVCQVGPPIPGSSPSDMMVGVGDIVFSSMYGGSPIQWKDTGTFYQMNTEDILGRLTGKWRDEAIAHCALAGSEES